MGSFTNVLAIAVRRLASRLRRASGAGGARRLREQKKEEKFALQRARAEASAPGTQGVKGGTHSLDSERNFVRNGSTL